MDTHSLGLYLREAREARELTLDDAVQTLKIRRAILESFESGDFLAIDSAPVQIKGFLRNYASFLGLDPDLVAQYYDDALDPRRARKRSRRIRQRQVPQHPAEDSSTSVRSLNDTASRFPGSREMMGQKREAGRRRRSGLLNMLAAIFVVVTSITVILFVTSQLIDESDPDIFFEADGGANRATRTPLPTIAPTFTFSPQIAALPEFQQDFDGRGIALTVQLQQRSWISVEVDGVEQLTRVASPGEAYNFRADREIVLTAANAAALVVFYNGQIQGSYGDRGREAVVSYSTSGVTIISGQAPEPTATPTDPATEPPIDSPTAELQPEPSPTFTTEALVPTPLPDVPQVTPQTEPVQTEATEVSGQESPSPAPEQAVATATPPATETPPPQATAILPPRVTPSDPTATKSAP